jgi:hypothetical protein
MRAERGVETASIKPSECSAHACRAVRSRAEQNRARQSGKVALLRKHGVVSQLV